MEYTRKLDTMFRDLGLYVKAEYEAERMDAATAAEILFRLADIAEEMAETS